MSFIPIEVVCGRNAANFMVGRMIVSSDISFFSLRFPVESPIAEKQLYYIASDSHNDQLYVLSEEFWG